MLDEKIISGAKLDALSMKGYEYTQLGMAILSSVCMRLKRLDRYNFGLKHNPNTHPRKNSSTNHNKE